VKDVDKAVEYFEGTFGWGPFKVQEAEAKGVTYRGKTGNCRLKIAFAQSNQLEIELVQVLEGETPHTEFLREHGEGLQHLRCCVDDLDSVLTELAKKGIEPIFYRSEPQMGISFAYLNTDIDCGVMLELIDAKFKAVIQPHLDV
jgi:methylmalonyl-CoA/ethylmalonyl-CoA epimerase